MCCGPFCARGFKQSVFGAALPAPGSGGEDAGLRAAGQSKQWQEAAAGAGASRGGKGGTECCSRTLTLYIGLEVEGAKHGTSLQSAVVFVTAACDLYNVAALLSSRF